MIWFLVIIAAGGILLFALVSKTTTKPKSHRRGNVDRELVATRWRDIEQMADSGGPSLKGAISEADKLLDYVMRQQGGRGETMAERLKRSESRLSDKEAVWRAHKLRNHLAHEVGFEVTQSHAREAVVAYHRALRDLGALV